MSSEMSTTARTAPATTVDRKAMLTRDYQEMIEADAGHLVKALVKGDRVHAHQFVDAIITNRRLLEDLEHETF
jgi:hypothetical protein